MLVIGCGNRDRSDDGAGVMVAERMRELGVKAEICTGESLALIEAWNGADAVSYTHLTLPTNREV